MYDAMRAHFGPQDWWPASRTLPRAERKLEVCVGAILTQNTNWRNVEKALGNLLDAGCMRIAALAGLTEARLAELIRPAGYFNVKARRLKRFLEAVADGAGGDIEAFLDRPAARLREALLAIHGIGPETADSMILYAAGRCTFVVDAYTRRIFARHGLVEPGANYDAVKALCELRVPARTALYNDYHAQLVAVGKTYCRPTARCEGCPLAAFPHDRRGDRGPAFRRRAARAGRSGGSVVRDDGSSRDGRA